MCLLLPLTETFCHFLCPWSWQQYIPSAKGSPWISWLNAFFNKWTQCLHFCTYNWWYFTLLFMVFFLWWYMSSCLGTLEICAGIVMCNYLIWGEGWCQEESFGNWHGYISRIFFPITQMWGRFTFTFEINLLEHIKMWWLVLIYYI